MRPGCLFPEDNEAHTWKVCAFLHASEEAEVGLYLVGVCTALGSSVWGGGDKAITSKREM